MSQPFVPRPWQHGMIEHALDHRRCALWAKPGLGKSSVILSVLDSHFMSGEDHPALVLAPLRVARRTWSRESQKWDDFSHLDVVPIVGTVKERLAALRQDAPIFTTNYENLVWLTEHWGDRWPYRIIVADESTKLKSLRLSFQTSKKGKEFINGQGGKRARALGKIAHMHTTHFYELTGTPSPNGLADLWGQLWFLDGGRRLGRTFEAFKQRWFRSKYNGFGIEPLPHAEAQIYEAVKDICMTVDGADWLDLKEPVVNIVKVDLPPSALRTYRAIEKEMFAQIGDRTAEAFNAAAKTQKCIAEGTPVLTRRGWMPIQLVIDGDEVWDGVEWVVCGGASCNSFKPVVECWGVRMTLDHRVLTGEGWRTAKEILDGLPSNRFDRADFRLPDGIVQRGENPATTESGVVEVPLYMRKGSFADQPKLTKQKPGTPKVLRLPSRGDDCLGNKIAWDVWSSGMARMVRHAAEVPQPERQGLAQLRRAWANGVRTLAGILHKLLGGHGADLPRRYVCGAEKQLQGVQPLQLPVGAGPEASEQPPNVCLHRDPDGPDDGSTGREAVRGEAHNVVRTPEAGLAGGEGDSSVRVYDVVNAGPRHRFTVLGDEGPLIVHNCLQIANGACYVDPLVEADDNPRSKEWREVHDEKLQALDELLSEMSGNPVIVVYEFRSDLARLLKAFPEGRVLKTDADEADFKAGKIPYLFVHPQSGGHGIDGFQYVCHEMVFFGNNWNLEYHDQIVERIGPVRQMQAGFDRPVYLHYIVAENTVDELVMERRQTKRDVQDLLMEAAKRRK